MTRAELLAAFDALPPYRRYQALRIAVGDALRVWRAYRQDGVPLDYRDGVVGELHTVDDTLPARAVEDIDAMLGGTFPDPEITHGYLEPITAMQDGDLDFPSTIELAYYAIYNLHRLIAKEVTPTVYDRQSTSPAEHVVVAQVCGAIAATDAWGDEWWARIWDAWACTPDLPHTPRLSEPAFEALVAGDLDAALRELVDDSLMRAIVLALSGQQHEALLAAAAGLGAALTDELRTWLEAHLFELCPDAIAVAAMRAHYIVIRSERIAGWNLVARHPEVFEYPAVGPLFRLVRYQHDAEHGQFLYCAGECVDAQGAWATFLEERITDGFSRFEIYGARSLAALGPGVIAHHASRVVWSAGPSRAVLGEAAVLGAAVDDDGSAVATHDGVRVSIWERGDDSPSCARITGPAAPRTIAIGGRDLLVVWVDGSVMTRRLGQ